MRWAEHAIRLAAGLVPRWRRDEWLEAWSAEVEAFREARSAGVTGLPSPAGLVLGAWKHAMWTKTEGWTMDSVLQDIRYAFRVLWRARTFTLVAAVTLALGIGANASIFSLINGLLLRPPTGIENPDRLVQIGRSYESRPRWDNFSWPSMELLRESDVFEGVAGYRTLSFLIGEGPDAELISGHLVTGNYFPLLGVGAVVGRTLLPDDDVTPGAHPVLMLGHGYWTRRFGSDPSVVGSTVLVGGTPYEVVGVAEAGFPGVEPIGRVPDVFAPTAMHPDRGGRLPFGEWGWGWINLFGRLSDGVTFASAEAAMPGTSASMREAHAQNDDMVVRLTPGLGLDPDERSVARQLAALLLGIVGLVLLVTCANVANLFVARSVTRRSEMGVRRALGAGTARLARQLITESVVLAVFATLLAWPLVTVASGVLPTILPEPITASLAPDWRVFAFLLGSGVLAGGIFGTAPALAAARRDTAHALRVGEAGNDRSSTRFRDAVVVLQLALSLGLLSGSALLGRSLMNARSADPGFDPQGVLVGYLALDLTGRYDGPTAMAFFDRFMTRIREIPGVRGVTFASQAPIVDGQGSDTRYPADRGPDARLSADGFEVGPDYFQTLGIPIVRGRAIDPFGESEPVAVINETLARRFWPDSDPIGQEIDGFRRARVVGVAADVQTRSLRSSPRPAVYEPLQGTLRISLHVRTAGNPMDFVTPIREVLAELDPGLPLTNPRDLQQSVRQSLSETRAVGLLVSVFAGLAMVLSVVGLYGLISFGVARRVREMGIRMALGADPARLVHVVLRRGLGLALVGVIAGLGISWLVGLALQSLLYRVSTTDLTSLGGAALLLLVAAGMASWLPARRASRVDAAVSLRS